MKKIPSFFLSLFKFILIIAFCVALSFIIVWPLWKFATGASKIYTIFTLSLFSILIVFFITKKIINSVKTKQAKNEK